MQFGDAEREYRNLKAQFTAGQLSEADFRARLEEMMIEDSEGKWWSIGYETGKWYYYDGEKWVRGSPPADTASSPAATTTGAAAAEARGASSAGSAAGDSGTTPGTLAAGALGAAAAATPASGPLPASASGAGSSDASAATRGVTSAAGRRAAAPGRPKGALTAAIIVIVVLALAVGAYLVLSQRFMVMSKGDMASMATPAPTAGPGQAGGMATVPAAGSQASPTPEAMAAMPAATSTPADAPTSAPPADTATSVPPTPEPSATSAPPTATTAASPVPDTPTAEPATPTPQPPTPTPAPTATKRPAPTPTRVPPTSQPAAAAPSVPGLVTGFEQFGGWKIGNEPYGTLTQSTQEAHSGSASARLDYNFPAVNNNYVVFTARPPVSIPGTANALNTWVLGDGSGHFLNVWIQDSQGEVRAFTFGNIPEAGKWTKMTATLDTTAPWPQGHISGPDNGKLDYPIKLYALVLDGVPDGAASKGTIYLDDIMSAQVSSSTASPTPAP